MASVSTSNTFSVAAHSTNGMSGLISGMDTDSMVEQMLSGTQSKIDKQEALKQQLTWKQEIYRNIITDINTFGNKYFSYDATTKLTSTDFFDQMISTTTSTAFKVSGTAEAPTGTTSVLVKQLAANAKATTTGKASRNALSGTMDLMAANRQRLVLKVGGSEVEVNLAGITQENMLNYLNDNLNGLKAEVDEAGNFTLTSASGQEIQVSGKSDSRALQMLGLTAYSSGTAKTLNGSEARVLTGKLALDNKMEFQISVDGVSNTFSVDVDQLRNGDLKDLNEQLKNTYGTLNNQKTPMVEAKIEGGRISFEVAGGNVKASGHQVQFSGNAFASELLGITSGQSSRISTTVALKEANLSTALVGDEFKFTINDVDFTFSKDDTIYTVMRTINNSGAGVRMTYSALADQFSIESTTAGSGDKIRMKQEQGNLLTAIFGQAVDDAGNPVRNNVRPGSTAVSVLAGSGNVTGTPKASLADTSSGTFTMYVNGSKVQVNISDAGSVDTMLSQINQNLERRFGYVGGDGSTAASKQQAVELTKDADGNIVVNSRNNAAISFDADADSTSKDLSALMGLAGKNNFVKEDTTDPAFEALKDAGVTFEEGGRLKVAPGFDASKITTQAAKDLFKQLFGVEANKVGLNTGDVNAGDFLQAGHNAVVEINGVETERSSNSFTIDGLNYELKTVTAGYEGAQQDDTGWYTLADDGKTRNYITDVRAETVSTERNIDGIIEGLKSFVEDYNKMVIDLNKKLQEDANYRDYAPLTSEQKKEMSEREIELWEEKAKEGLIRNDSDISIMLTSLRQALYQKPAGSKYALYDFGIETVSGLADKSIQGSLTINETKLRQMLTADPESLRQLFTDSTDGLAAKMKAAIDKAAKTSSGSPGSLVQLAGVAGLGTDKNNSITNQITSINDKLKQLNSQYEKERTRYWNQFTQMEQLIQQMQAQSAQLSNYFSF